MSFNPVDLWITMTPLAKGVAVRMGVLLLLAGSKGGQHA